MDGKAMDSAMISPDMLSSTYLPPRLIERQEQMNQIRQGLTMLLEHQTPVHLWLFGRPGTGKTASVRLVLRESKRKVGIKGIIINCWGKDSLYEIVDELVTQLRILRSN